VETYQLLQRLVWFCSITITQSPRKERL